MIAKDSKQRWYYSEEDLSNLEYLEPPPPQQGRLHEIIMEDPVSQLNAPKAIALQKDATVANAVKLMKKLRYGSVLVFDGEQLCGIFTEKDLLRSLDNETLKNPDRIEGIALKDVMTPEPQVLDEVSTLAHSLNLMSVGGYRHVPIMKGQEPAGFVSIRGILKYLTQNALDH